MQVDTMNTCYVGNEIEDKNNLSTGMDINCFCPSGWTKTINVHPGGQINKKYPIFDPGELKSNKRGY